MLDTDEVVRRVSEMNGIKQLVESLDLNVCEYVVLFCFFRFDDVLEILGF